MSPKTKLPSDKQLFKMIKNYRKFWWTFFISQTILGILLIILFAMHMKNLYGIS